MTTITEQRPGFWQRYGALWASAPKQFAAIIAIGVMGYVAFGLMWGLMASGLGLLFALLLGVFVIVAAFYVARAFGTAEIAVLEWAGMPRIPRPAFESRQGFLPWLGSMFGNPNYWLYVIHYLLPQFIVGVVSVTLAWVSVGIALGATTWFLWEWSLPGRKITWEASLPGGVFTADLMLTIVGVIFLILLPAILRGLLWMNWGVARGLLGVSRTKELQQKAASAEASRAAAVAAEDTALRRLERDIHDGPQQRLIRMQMDLASADRRVDESPEQARELIASATEQAREALDELRALSRGFAPPILQDRGLVPALESAATVSAVPIEIIDGMPAGTQLPPEIERNAYFIASEGLTNAVKHSKASRIEVTVALSEAPRGVTITIADNGVGGATTVPGHGIAGLQERVAGLGGSMRVSSPEGGPTVVTAHLPW